MTSTEATTRTAYDSVATLYAELVDGWVASAPLERAFLAAFAELVDGPVADVGCGPGHLTGHLHSLGVDVHGVDVSPEMVALARAAFPHLSFAVGSMTALDVADGSLGGILAHFSTIHTPPAELAAVLAEFHRALAPGGHLNLGFFGSETGSEPTPFDHRVTTAYHWPADTLADLVCRNGFVEVARLARKPGERERFLQSQLLVVKPQLS